MIRSLKPKSYILCALLFMTFYMSTASIGTAYEDGFSDGFDGTVIDNGKWIAFESTNMSGNPAYGGSIKVADSKISLSSSGSCFPWVQASVNPFPSTGDFAIEFRLTYTHIGHWGNGLWIISQPQGGSYTHDDIFSPEKSIFVVWADDESIYDHEAIRAYLLGREIYHSEAYGSLSLDYKMDAHVFRLEHLRGVYTLLIDGSEVASAPSEAMPNAIGFGHPPASYIPANSAVISSVLNLWGATWDSFEIDYISLLKQSAVSLTTGTSSTPLGFSIDLSGKLIGSGVEPVSGATVLLSYRFQGSSEWTPATSAVTAQDGSFLITWLPSATGSFVVKVQWLGNEEYAGSNEVTNVSITHDSIKNLFLAESNSTLSALSLDSSTNAISFSVSGPSGTSGYVRFLISKSLLADSTNLKVYMDGVRIAYSASFLDDLQVLYFVYSHSSHQVLISLPELEKNSYHLDNQDTPQPMPEGGLDGVELVLVAFIVGAALLCALVAVRLKKNTKT
jgi:hypothetical protein